jgi:hypothetical protein
MLLPMTLVLTLLPVGRTRIFWGILGSVIALVFVLFLSHQFRPVNVAERSKPALDFVSRAQIMEAPIPDIAKEAIIGPTADASELRPVPTYVAKALEDAEPLRVFDEL